MKEDKPKSRGTDKDRELIEGAQKRFELAASAFKDFFTKAEEDLNFCADDQWEPLARQNREISGRPCMQVDHVNPAVRQVVNESRQNRPSIEVDPVGDGADIDVAHIFGGLIRHIEYDSNADMVADVAEEYAVKTGLGFFRLISEYEDAKSFDQKLVFKAIHDPSTVYMDPFSREPDGSDQEFCFVVSNMPVDDFERQYPDSKMVTAAQTSGWENIDLPVSGWLTNESVRVAEYFYREYKNKKLYQLKNAVTDEVTVEITTPDIEKGIKDGTLEVLRTRDTETCTVKWVKMAADEILEPPTTWPSKYIPIIPVKGEEMWVNGERFMCGMVRRLRDPQRALNYLRSAQIEAVDLAPKAPFIGPAGAFDTFEQDWRDANRKNLAYLEYNQKDVNGDPIAPGSVQRSSVEPAIQAIMASGGAAIDDIKAISGVYDASLGNQSNEESGVAIIARKEQTSNANFHYYDNLVRSWKHAGRICVEVIPTYYDSERTIRIIKPTGEQEMKTINAVVGPDKKIDFKIGKYDVIVKTGPTYQTKRQRLVEQGTAIIKSYPEAAPLIADLLIGASDFEGAQEIAARLRTQVPPEVLAATGENGGGDPKAQLQAVQGQLNQASEAIKQLNAHAEQVENELKDTKEELQLTKLAQKADTTKAELDYNIKAKQLALDEATTELEFMVKEREFKMQEQQLEIQKQQLGIKATQAMADLNDTMHDKEEAWLDRSRDKTIHTISQVKPLPEINVGTVPDPDLGGKFGTGKELK